MCVCVLGLEVEGLYRCCGSVTKVTELVQKLREAPENVILETNEVSIQEIAGALKHFLRTSTPLIPSSERESWAKAAGNTHTHTEALICTESVNGDSNVKPLKNLVTAGKLHNAVMSE